MATDQLTDNSEELVTVTLPRRRADLLFRLLDAVEKIEGWCVINRWIGKWILFAGLTAIILLSDAIDRAKNMLHSFGKH